MRKLERERQTHKILPTEVVLDDDHPMLRLGIYIVDGVVKRYNGQTTTVGEYKRALQSKEVRRFDVTKKRETGVAYLGDKMEVADGAEQGEEQARVERPEDLLRPQDGSGSEAP